MSRGQDPRIVFFDIDGTLVPGRSSSSFLAERLGHRRRLDTAEAAYAAGELTNHEVCAVDARGWAGHTRRDVEAWLDRLPLVGGIGETLTWCRSAGAAPYLASLAWSPVGSHLAGRFGFDGYCGPRLEADDGVFTGDVAVPFDELDKRDFALETCRALGADPRRCVAIGDGRSDLPLFDVVGFSIAFNASADARERATTCIDSGELTAVVPALERWLGTGEGRAEPEAEGGP